MMGEKLESFPSDCYFTPKEGWALHERPLPSRLNDESRRFLVDIFNAGRENKNNRVSPESAEILLHTEFPDNEECWLSVKQVYTY